MKIQYCIITKDEAGQTIQVFDTLDQANEFANFPENPDSSIDNRLTIEDETLDNGNPYGGMEVGDNCADNHYEIIARHEKRERDIQDRFDAEFVDEDTGLLNIGKYDHERIINFISNEMK